MASDGLKEMFEGDFGDMCANKLSVVLMGMNGAVKCVQMGRKEPLWCKWKFLIM